MPTQFSLPLVAALLLASLVAAQAIGLRSPKNIDEAFGLGGSICIVLLVSIALQWPIAHFVLQPLGLPFLNTLVTVLLIAAGAAFAEAALRRKLPRFFPIHGDLLPQIIVGALILALPLIQDAASTFGDALVRAASFGIGAKLLIALFHTLRQHAAAAETPLPLRGPAIDLVSAGLMVAALSGIAGLF